jgi:hypothetical protein
MCRREEALTSSILKRQLLHWQEGSARGQEADPWGAAADSGLQEVLVTVAPLLQGQVGGNTLWSRWSHGLLERHRDSRMQQQNLVWLTEYNYHLGYTRHGGSGYTKRAV